MHEINYSFLIDCLEKAITTLSDIADINDDDFVDESEKKENIKMCLDDFYEWAEIKKQEHNSAREKLARVSSILF